MSHRLALALSRPRVVGQLRPAVTRTLLKRVAALHAAAVDPAKAAQVRLRLPFLVSRMTTSSRPPARLLALFPSSSPCSRPPPPRPHNPPPLLHDLSRPPHPTPLPPLCTRRPRLPQVPLVLLQRALAWLASGGGGSSSSSGSGSLDPEAAAAAAAAMDLDQTECLVANLIFRKYVKGYIAHKSRVLVISKQEAFPPLQGVAGLKEPN